MRASIEAEMPLVRSKVSGILARSRKSADDRARRHPPSDAMDLRFVRKIRRSRRGSLIASSSANRHVTAWIAVVCLCVQLAASAACGVGTPLDAAFAGPERGLFPICHAGVGGEELGQTSNGRHTPAHQQGCLFCQVHCHAAMALTPTIAVVSKPSLVVSASAEPPLLVVRPSARFPAGAPPRGPPSAG